MPFFCSILRKTGYFTGKGLCPSFEDWSFLTKFENSKVKESSLVITENAAWQNLPNIIFWKVSRKTFYFLECEILAKYNQNFVKEYDYYLTVDQIMLSNIQLTETLSFFLLVSRLRHWHERGYCEQRGILRHALRGLTDALQVHLLRQGRQEARVQGIEEG